MARSPLCGLVALAVVVVLPTLAPASDGCGAPAETSLRVLGVEHDIFSTSVVQSGNCGFLTASYVAGETTDLLLSKVVPGGKGWTKQYASNRSGRKLGYVLPTRASGMTEPGAWFSWVSAVPIGEDGTAVALDDVLLTVDENGQARWARQFREPPETARGVFGFTSVLRVEDGFYVLAHKVRETNNADDSVALLRLDNDGRVIWAMDYPRMRTEMYASLVKTPDGHLLVGGLMRVNDHGEYDPDGMNFRTVVVKLNLDGTLDWARGVAMVLDKRAGGLGAGGLQTIGLAVNGDIILIQSYGYGGALLTRLTADGDHVWSRQFNWAVEAHATATWVTQVVADGDDLLIVGSSGGFQFPAHNYQVNYNAFLARLSFTGTPEWIRSYGKTSALMGHDKIYDADYGTGLLLMPDRQLVMIGYTDSFSNAPLPHRQYDSILAISDIEGFVRRGSNLVTTPDIGNRTEVWSKQVDASITSPHFSSMTLHVVSEAITYTASDATLVERELPRPSSAFALNYDVNTRELASNMSMFQIDDPAVDDPDGDGLRQDWENEAIRLLNPVYELDEEEDWLKNRAWHHVANLVRVSPWPGLTDSQEATHPRYVILYFAVTWSADYGGFMTGNPFTAAEDHRGDIEKVMIALRVIGDRRARIEWITTSAHGDANSHKGVWHVKDRTCNPAKIADLRSQTVGQEIMCDTLRFNRDGVVILEASEDKHALYPSAKLCNHVTLIREGGVDVWGENCGWDPSLISTEVSSLIADLTITGDPGYLGKGLWRFDAYNVGEPDAGHTLVNDLSWPESWIGLTDAQKRTLIGTFPHEFVWFGFDASNLGDSSAVHALVSVLSHLDSWIALTEAQKQALIGMLPQETAGSDSHEFCGGLRPGDRWRTFFQVALWLTMPDACVNHLPGSSLAMTNELQEKLDSHYRVTITTARSAGSGTDAGVTVRLENAHNTYPVTAVGSFDKGDTDIIHLGPIDIGPIERVTLSRDNMGDSPDWRVVKIEVARKGTADSWVWSSAAGVVVTTQGVTLPLTPQ